MELLITEPPDIVMPGDMLVEVAMTEPPDIVIPGDMLIVELCARATAARSAVSATVKNFIADEFLLLWMLMFSMEGRSKVCERRVESRYSSEVRAAANASCKQSRLGKAPRLNGEADEDSNLDPGTETFDRERAGGKA